MKQGVDTKELAKVAGGKTGSEGKQPAETTATEHVSRGDKK